MLECVGVIVYVLQLLFNYIGLVNVYYAESIVHFVIIPGVYLMNNDDTKAIIFGERWYQGIRHMLGIHTKPISPISVEMSNQTLKENRNPLTSYNPIPKSQNNMPLFRQLMYPRRCSSAHNLFPLAQLLDRNEIKKLQRRNSQPLQLDNVI